MIDASKFPKAARLQQQREEKFAAEQTRMKAQLLLEQANAAISVKKRMKRQQGECEAAQEKIAKRNRK